MQGDMQNPDDKPVSEIIFTRPILTKGSLLAMNDKTIVIGMWYVERDILDRKLPFKSKHIRMVLNGGQVRGILNLALNSILMVLVHLNVHHLVIHIPMFWPSQAF